MILTNLFFAREEQEYWIIMVAHLQKLCWIFILPLDGRNNLLLCYPCTNTCILLPNQKMQAFNLFVVIVFVSLLLSFPSSFSYTSYLSSISIPPCPVTFLLPIFPFCIPINYFPTTNKCMENAENAGNM